MRFRLFILAAVAAAASASYAWAADATPGDSALACDFFEAQLIGVLCGHTAYVAPSGQGSDETINQTTTSTSRLNGGYHTAYGGTTVEHWDYRDAYESVTLAISPWPGVRFHVGGEAFQYDDEFVSQSTGGLGGLLAFRGGGLGGGHLGGATTTTTNLSGSYGGWQEIGAEATIWDRQTASGRYVLDISGGMQMFPGGGLYRGRDLQQIGWESGAEWRLGGSGLSLDYYSTTFLQRYDNPGALHADSTSRLLLASDAYGVAIGPRLEGTSVFWHAAGVNTGWSEVQLGGEALLAPFRLTSFPVLRDMTLDLIGVHSIGQAALVPDWAGSSSAYDYSATARFNFRF